MTTIKFTKLGNINIDDFLYLYQKFVNHELCFGYRFEDAFRDQLGGENRSQQMDTLFNEMVQEDFCIALKYNVQYIDSTYKLYLTIDREKGNWLNYHIIGIDHLLNDAVKDFFKKIDKLNYEDTMKHPLFTNAIYELKVLNSSIIKYLIDNKRHEEYKELLLEKFRYFTPCSTIYKIANIFIDDYNTIFIKYNSWDELYYKVILHNFNFLKQMLKYDFDENKSIEDNFKNIINSRYLRKSLDITIF